MTAHTCKTLTPGCYRCELNRDELASAEPLTDAHQELRERAAHEIWAHTGSEAAACCGAYEACASCMRAFYLPAADAVLALLDEPTLHALLGLRQVGWKAPLSRLLHDDPRRTPPAGFVPVYVKEAPRAR